MRYQFSLDALISHALAPMDDDTMVVKPRWRKLENQILKLKGRISTVQNRMSKLGKDEAKAKQRDRLSQESRLLETEHEKLQLEKYEADSLICAARREDSQCLDGCLNHSSFSSTSCAYRRSGRDTHGSGRGKYAGQKKPN